MTADDAAEKPPKDAWRRAHGAYPGVQVAASFILGWLFLGAGLVGLVCVPLLALRTHDFLRHAVHGTAPIVAVKTDPPGRHEGHDTYRAIIEVARSDGSPTRLVVGDAAYPNPYRVGEAVAVLYPPGNPAAAVLEKDSAWIDTILLGIFSTVLVGLGIGIVLWMRYFVSYGPEQLVFIDRWFVPLKFLTWW